MNRLLIKVNVVVIFIMLVCTKMATQQDSGPVPRDCLDCLRKVGGGTEGECNPDGGSDSCGPYQIKNVYYIDAQERDDTLTQTWQDCTKTTACSEKVIQVYMSRYAIESRLGVAPTCEHFARIHNGGPNGFRKCSTKKYWKKVKACLNG